MNGELGSECTPIADYGCIKKESKRSRKDYLRDYEVKIQFLSVGCIITIGCKTIPFSTISEGTKELNAYFNNPEEMYHKWNEKFASEE